MNPERLRILKLLKLLTLPAFALALER